MDFKGYTTYKRLSEVNLKLALETKAVESVSFLVLAVSSRDQKNGGKFMSITIVDKDIREEAKLFSASEKQIELVKAGMVFKGNIEVKTYEQSPTGYSVIIKSIEECDDNIQSYIQWTENMEDRARQFSELVNTVKDSKYFPMAYGLIQDNWVKFSQWTAASGIHHNKLGGLMSHTTEVMLLVSNICDFVTLLYPDLPLDKELAICGAMIHDIGKVEELNADLNSGATEYSNEAALVTHIMTGIKMLAAKASSNGTPTTGDLAEDLNKLTHIIGSHHGFKEWGCPIEPAMIEAEIVFYADELSATAYRYNRDLGITDPGSNKSFFYHGTRKNVYRGRMDSDNE